MLIVGPEIPEAMRPFAMSVVEAIRALQQPQQPVTVPAVTLAQVPPAGDWPNGVLRVAELNILAVSDGAAWIRQDTGAPI